MIFTHEIRLRRLTFNSYVTITEYRDINFKNYLIYETLRYKHLQQTNFGKNKLTWNKWVTYQKMHYLDFFKGTYYYYLRCFKHIKVSTFYFPPKHELSLLKAHLASSHKFNDAKIVFMKISKKISKNYFQVIESKNSLCRILLSNTKINKCVGNKNCWWY